MEWHRIAARLPGSDWPAWEHGEPVEGEFPEDQIRLLAVALREFTATPERCWFCLWVGFGGIEEDGAQVRLPGREYTLSSGVIEAITSFHFGPVWQTPQLWWPDDHVWYVASDIDLKSTYLGASSACVDALLPSGELEVLRTSADARVDIEADTVNRE